MRTFKAERPEDQRNMILVKQLRTSNPILVYARRSDPTAKNAAKDKTQSREMQTGDMVSWAKKKGWREDIIYPYFADLGLSGTLRPDQRPDMLRLFDDLDAGRFDHCTIALWQENRAFRDETHIYYNQLIEKILAHDVVIVVISPQLYIYDMRDQFDKERLREKFKEAANLIPNHIKGWLHPAQERAAWEDDEWAGLGDLPPGFICDYEESSPTYKHIIPYWPHIEKVAEHFELYMELGGENSLYFRLLSMSPIIFPEFPEDMDRRVLSRFKLSRHPAGGYYVKSEKSLVRMFTQPLYHGYHAVKGVIRRDEQGEKIRSFEPVFEQELLDFAFYRNAHTDFDGKPLNKKKIVYFQKDREAAILKFRIKSDQGNAILHVRREVKYDIRELQEGTFTPRYNIVASVKSEDIDRIVVQRLLERARSLSQKRESLAAYEQSAKAIRNKRLSKIKQIEVSLADIEEKQIGLALNSGKIRAEVERAKKAGDVKKQQMQEKLLAISNQAIKRMEEESQNLTAEKAQLEEDAENDIGSLEDELVKLENGWEGYSFKKRRSLVNFAIREVRINKVSTHWIEIQVLWLHEEWGQEHMYYRREHSSKNWTDEEVEILAANYKDTPALELLKMLPEKTWGSIITYAYNHPEIPARTIKCGGVRKNEAFSDMKFREESRIDETITCTNWGSLAARYRCPA